MDDVIQAIQRGQIEPVYFVCGESFPRDRVVQAVRQAVVGDTATAFNYDAFESKEASAARVLAAARTMPMMGDRRLVLVRDAHQIPAEELNRLLPYIKDPSPHACLLLVAEKVDLRLKFFATLKKQGALLRFDPLKDRQVPGWIAAEARRDKIALAPGTAERIAAAVGNEMAQLASALERLSLYVGGEGPVTPEHVEELLAETRQRSIFELTNAVGRGDRREALLVLRRMLAARESGIRIVAMLARHLRLLWQIKELSAARQPNKAIAAQVGIHPFFLNDMQQQGQRFDSRMLQRTLRALFVADRSLKSSRLSDALVLDQLVLSLCDARGTRRARWSPAAG